jgi:membrane dipeptidase
MMEKTLASELHSKSIVIDGLNASNFVDERVLERLHAGGVTAVNATVAAWHSPEEARALIRAVGDLLEKRSDLALPVRNTADIMAAKASRRVGVILGFQDAAPIGDDIGLLEMHYELGVRIIQLTYNHANRVGSGCLTPDDAGLTAFGRRMVAEMNRLGILVDLSHCGPRTTLEAVQASEKPVGITHANARRFLLSPRNKSDDAIREMSARGGVIGAVAFGGLLTLDLPATLEHYAAAIDDLVDLAGVQHVGLGPDFMEEMPVEIAMQALKGLPAETLQTFGATPPTQGFESASAFPNVTKALMERGYQPEQVQAIIGRNWLRLYQEVWRG